MNATPECPALTYLGTLRINKVEPRGGGVGGSWVTGTMAGHTFEVLVFPEPARGEGYEISGTRISKLFVRGDREKVCVACFDRGWDLQPTTEAARTIVDVLAAGIAETVFGV